jgi:hypothetical protein
VSTPAKALAQRRWIQHVSGHRGRAPADAVYQHLGPAAQTADSVPTALEGVKQPSADVACGAG